MAGGRIKSGILGAGILLGLVLVILILRPRIAPFSRAVERIEDRSRASAANPAPRAAPPPSAAEEPSRLADGLRDPKGDASKDMRILDGVFAAYRSALREGNPVGENAEITAALRGRNRLGYAFIPEGSPAVDSRGELCDRWGSPYFFHQLSGEKMEIRSAGPDRRLWTEDDVVFTP